MYWKRKHSVIHVEFFDHASGACFARSDMPVEQLPQSFEASTTLHLRDKDYDVIEAKPMTSAEFSRTGKLRLLLREVKIEHIDPKELLFSLPTIAYALPPIAAGSSKLGKDVLELHEDDWRQTEFVEASAWPQVEEHLTQIRRVHEEERVGMGFRNLHVRKDFLHPLKRLLHDRSGNVVFKPVLPRRSTMRRERNGCSGTSSVTRAGRAL